MNANRTFLRQYSFADLSAMSSIAAVIVTFAPAYPFGVQAGILTVDGTTCTLVDAITAANTDQRSGGCPRGSGDDTLLLTAPVYTLTEANNQSEGHSANGLPVITSAIYLNADPDGDGQGGALIQRLETNGNPPYFRLIEVAPTGRLVARNVTFRNGILLSSRDGQNSCGSGIFSHGSLSLIRSTVKDNFGESFYGGFPAGICNDGGSVTLYGSLVTHNSVAGIYNGVGSASLWESTVSDTLPDYAGFVCEIVNSGTISLERSAVLGKATDFNMGTGLCNDGIAKVTNSTISGNSRNGLRNRGTATFRHVTVSGNGLPEIYGPISDAAGVTSFDSGLVILVNSIVANNSPSDCDVLPDYPGGSPGSAVFAGINLIEDGSCDAAAQGSRTGDPDLGPLADNGGATVTQTLQSCSGAIDAADDAFCAETDQRGVKRPQGQHCDIGAFELEAEKLAPCSVPFRSSWKRALAP